MKERNNERELDRQYNDETLSALVLRYEDPNNQNRWDNPLFNLTDNKLDEISSQINQVLFERKAPKANECTTAVCIII